jgi:acyl-CoA synthetase (NDP forming)
VVATFASQVENFSQPLLPETQRGRTIAIVSQSGGIGFSFYHRGRPRQLRFSYVVSTGNEAVLGSFDFVDWCLDEGRADIVLLYLETIRDVETFRRVAIKAADLGKPLIVAKMGRSEAGSRAAASHTAALAGSDAAYDGIFRHYGVIRADDMDQQLDIAAAFAFCPLPKGRRVAVLASSGGSGVWMSDILAMQGLDLPMLDEGTRAAIDCLIPSYGSSANPIDLTAQVVRQVGYARITEILLRSHVVDCVVIVGSLTFPTTLKRDAEALAELTRTSEKPIVFCTYTMASAEAIEIAAQAGLPVFTSMPGYAAAIRAMVDYQDFLAQRPVIPQSGGVSADEPDCARRPATLARLAAET